MEIHIKMNRNIPEKTELRKFIDHLMSTFPLIRTGKVFILIEKTRNLYMKADCGNLCGYECKDGKKVSRITMNLPKIYTLQRAIVTLAHEYCHSLQSDRSEKAHCMGSLSRKEKAAGGNERELEADVFGVKVASEYMNIPPHTLLEELWDGGLYRISKPACAVEFGYVHIKRESCV